MDDEGYGKVFWRNVWRNRSRDDNLPRAKFARKWQTCTKTIQKNQRVEANISGKQRFDASQELQDWLHQRFY
jgi:hypothetical protein